MTGLSQEEFGRRGGVSQQAVSLAIARGYLVRDADGRLDPRHAGNASWLKRHRQGSDVRGRPLDTHHNGRSSQKAGRDHNPAPQAAADLSDDFIRRFLAERLPDDRVVDMLEEIRREVGALRKELRTDRPSYAPGIAEVQHAIAGLNIKLNVCFHQLTLAIQGKPLTVAPGAFEQDEIAADARKR